MRALAYRLYARRLRQHLRGGPVPRHIAIVMDGNRRWARAAGYANPSVGHRYGADHLDEVLGWCATAGVTHVTVYVCSVDNLHKRDEAEVAYLMRLIEDVIGARLAQPGSLWQLHAAGRLDALPDRTRDALKSAVGTTSDRDTGFHLTVAVGYDGRGEIVDALRSLLDAEARAGTDIADLAERIAIEDIAAHLYTAGMPDPDLVIRTSGERRLSNFLLWQAAHAELYFCDAYWPGFREVDFLRALRSYAARRTRG